MFRLWNPTHLPLMRAAPKKETLAKTGCISVSGGPIWPLLSYYFAASLTRLLYFLSFSKFQKITVINIIDLFYEPLILLISSAF